MLIRTIDETFVRLGKEKNNLVLLVIGNSFVVDDRLVELAEVSMELRKWRNTYIPV